MGTALFDLDTTSSIPIYAQLVSQVKRAVAAGILHSGDTLPSLRDVATHLRINPMTVARAYRDLETAGIITTEPGRGSFINVLSASTVATVANLAPPADRESVLYRKVHIEEKLVLDIPQVTPLCDSIKVLTKGMIGIGDCKLYCEREGKGTPTVLVNGGPGCSHQIFHPHFSRAARFAQMIYYDQRGEGQSDYDPSGEKYTVRQAVEDLDNLRTALKIDKWVVVGHSYGGFLAQCYALEHPESVMGLVLICAAPGTPNVPIVSRQSDYMTAEEIAKVRSIFRDDKLTQEQLLYNAHMNGDWKRQSFYRPTTDELARMARYEWKPASGFRERICPDAGRIDLEGKFANFDIPTLIMEAKWDLTWNTDKPENMLKNHPVQRW